MRILIQGAGIAGLSAAIALAQDNILGEMFKHATFKEELT